jgi:hypothetical protein
LYQSVTVLLDEGTLDIISAEWAVVGSDAVPRIPTITLMMLSRQLAVLVGQEVAHVGLFHLSGGPETSPGDEMPHVSGSRCTMPSAKIGN